MSSSSRGPEETAKQQAAAYKKADNQYAQGNYTEAFHLAQELVNQNYPPALYMIGYMYSEGHGVKKNEENAAKYFQRAAELGHARAQYMIAKAYLTGEGVVRNEVTAVRWLEDAAKQGEMNAEYVLGEMYKHGRGGLNQNINQAFLFFDRAAKRGQTTAARYMEEKLKKDEEENKIIEGLARKADV